MTEATGKRGESVRKPVGTLEYLLRIHQDIQCPGRVFIYFGDILINRFVGFVEGYRACMQENELPDDGYSAFLRWLQEVKRHAAEPDWTVRFPRGSQESQEDAIRRYLDLVAEFVALHTEVGEKRPSIAGPRHSGTFDTLLRIRRELEQGRWGLLGESGDVERFAAFVDGYNACRMANGIADERYSRFFDWLRDDKHELPGEGWPAKYLRDCRGDHAQAVRKYLDFAAEFAALQGGVVDNSS
jgi:hypothetical protein